VTRRENRPELRSGATGANRFPESFRFGVATADHQCEAHIDGADDIRDVWERVRAETPRGIATDFWNRYEEDIALAASLGCTIFRISLSWARLETLPGVWSAEAFAHYRAVLSSIRAKGMRSVVTLLHNTWPVHIQAAGGLVDDAFPDRFARYAARVERELGDLIDYYITINEPNQLGYGFVKPWWSRTYAMPPGMDRNATTADQMEALARFVPNLFLANSRARNAIRALRPTAMIGQNSFLLGLPGWVQALIDGNATRIKSKKQLIGQGKRLTQRPWMPPSRVDVSIAQITMTPDRMDDVLFTESYLDGRFAVLRSGDGNAVSRVGVTGATTAVECAGAFFPSAAISTFESLAAAVDALASAHVDAVFSDDILLEPYAKDGLRLEVLSDRAQPFCAAVSLGKRTLLNAIDLAVRAFKQVDASGTSPWDRSMAVAFPHRPTGPPPTTGRRATIASAGADDASLPTDVPQLDKSLESIRRKGVLRVGIHAGMPALCERLPDGSYSGIEPDLARFIGAWIFRDAAGRVDFVELGNEGRVQAAGSPFQWVDRFLKSLSVFTTTLNTNWWNLGLAGRLSPVLCPEECVGALDFVGLDYYWGIDALRLGRIEHLLAAAEGRYANAPVFPSLFRDIVIRQHRLFPDLPMIVVENGCVTAADGVSRAEYLVKHIAELQRVVAEGIPVVAYLCWSITSNREWGLPFDDNSDFGLYHIDLDHDATLTRVKTAAAETYQAIIAARSADIR
jgi:beta-glucosidase/6-phospho-beta-glucosidase/beta-galactosidase/ABC-type amino acid transport substrate-binding protein